MSMHVPLMIGTVMSHNFGIHASEDNPTSRVQAGDSRNISLVLLDWHPYPGLGPDSRGPVLNVLVEYKSSTSSSTSKKVDPLSSSH